MKETIHFDAPEFYPQNSVVLRVEGAEGKFLVVSEGERDAQYGNLNLRTPQQFRDAFPDGKMPEESDALVWTLNAWFAIYDVTNSEESEALGEPEFSLAEALSYALDLAYGEL
jgi:hypothetical protein